MALLVTTSEDSGIDRYSQEIGKRVAATTITSRRYLSWKAAVALLRRLQKGPGVVHFPSQHFARLGLFLARPFVITVHDLARMCFPFGRETLRERMGLRFDVLGLRKAEHIIAVSARTKADLMDYLDIPRDRISVIYNGIDRRVFRPVAGRPFDFRYLLYVGTERPRKNLSTLLEAFAALKRDDGVLSDVKLVKVGTAGRSDNFRQATLREVRRLGLDEDVIFTGQVSDEQLAAYYSSAEGLVLPSLYEGFGLPLLEAMACGCPVIAANGSALPEVAGDAALFFNPRDPRELALSMRRLLTEPALRDQLTSKGFHRAAHFSWDKAADETLQVYRNVENGSNGRHSGLG